MARCRICGLVIKSKMPNKFSDVWWSFLRNIDDRLCRQCTWLVERDRNNLYSLIKRDGDYV